MRYFIHLAYNGTRFCGWQRQPHSPSIQENIETVLTTLLGEEISITGAGRTDSGVHASSYYAHFDTNTSFSPQDLRYKLNSIKLRRKCNCSAHSQNTLNIKTAKEYVKILINTKEFHAPNTF